MTSQDPTPSVRLTESTRVEAFSDAVMSIIITILVLELRVPPHQPGRLLATLTSMWPMIVAFLISFLRISVIWLNHHAMFVQIRRVDRTLLWLNLAILLACTIIPLPTAVLADALHGGNPADLRLATALYVSLAALQSAAWIPVFSHLRRHPELVEPGTGTAFFRAQRVRPWIAIGIDAAAAVVCIVSPILALVLWTLSVIFLAVTSDGIRALPMTPRWRRRKPKEAREA